jgi:hypothetical protein
MVGCDEIVEMAVVSACVACSLPTDPLCVHLQSPRQAAPAEVVRPHRHRRCLSACGLTLSSSQKEKKKIIRDLTTAVLARKPKMCNFIEWKDMKIVYKRFG